jgi:hypothetical protein
MKRLKKHIRCAPKTLAELKQHIEYGKCYPVVTKEMFYELIVRLEEVEEELK